MALVKVLDKYDLEEEFTKFGRNYFSLDGYQALIDLIAENDGDTYTDLDVIAICCEFTESSPEDIFDNYSNLEGIEDCKNEDGEIDADMLADILSGYTIATTLRNGNILYQNF